MKRYIKAPSPGLAVGIVALVVALSGTAYAVTSSQVTIVDGTSGNAATVDPSGHLKVGDGAGPLNVGGTVNAPPAPPHRYFESSVTASNSSLCHPFDMPPAGNALILRSVLVDVTNNPTPASDHGFTLQMTDPTCDLNAGVTIASFTVRPTSIDPVELHFDPGVAVPEGSEVAVSQGGSDIDAIVYIYGYSVPSAQVPAAAAAARPSSK